MFLKSGFICLVDVELFVECLQAFQHVAAYVDEIRYAQGFEFFAACGITGDNQDFFAFVQCGVSFGSQLSVFFVAGTQHYDVCLGGTCSFETFLYGFESQIVDDFVTRTGKKVARELGSGQSHIQIADGQ
jgi:hypothetical protein